jgi:superfamily II DNA/RNA helicase
MNELKSLGFNKPTPIQAKTLHFSLSGRDVIGAAETGSGKTLAFGIPILEYIFKKVKDSNQLVGLILTPTRELAMQIRDHLQHISKNSLIKVRISYCYTFFSKKKKNINVKLLSKDYNNCGRNGYTETTAIIIKTSKYYCRYTWSFMGIIL